MELMNNKRILVKVLKSVIVAVKQRHFRFFSAIRRGTENSGIHLAFLRSNNISQEAVLYLGKSTNIVF